MPQSHDAEQSGSPPDPIIFNDRKGLFIAPDGARTVVIFAHGTGSDHRSPRNTDVAARLRQAGHATFLIDLLNEHERTDDLAPFDPYLQAGHILSAIRWVHEQSGISKPRIGLFGAGSGAGAALIAAGRAAEHDNLVAVVCRGGRPDLADQWLAGVDTPTLLIVGERDSTVLGLNREALGQMTCESALHIVANADRLFDGPGQLDQVADLASQWFGDHLHL